MATELGEHLVNAFTPVDHRRRADRNAAGLHVSRSLVPEGAVETREKLEAAVKSGGFAQMQTTIMPVGRPRYPDEIAQAVLFLASDMASSISGANLIVDGAQPLR